MNPIGLPPPKMRMYECGAMTASEGNWKWCFFGELSASRQPAKEMGDGTGVVDFDEFVFVRVALAVAIGRRQQVPEGGSARTSLMKMKRA